jgi:hypothetical protein
MRTRLARRSRWVWLGLCLIVAAGVALTGAGRRTAPPSPEIHLDPAASAAATDGAADTHADRDTCDQQLD